MMRKLLRAVTLALLLTMICSAAMAASYSTLEYGDRGDAVKKMQQALNSLGYSTGGADGKFGSGTENAVRLFQKANGLKQDGKAGNQTLTLLYQLVESGSTDSSTGSESSTGGSSSASGSDLFGGNYATLEYGSRGTRVTTLQSALNQLGYSAGSADGKFGAGTQRAVVAFQQANGLEADGKAGRMTLKKIEALMVGDTSSGSAGSSSSSSGSTATTPDTDSGNSSGSSSSTSTSTAVPTRTLRKGYTGDDVKSVQTRLKALGYYTGSIDGKYGSGTMAAVKAFQSANGLKADGLAGTATYKKLYADDATSSGSSGATTEKEEMSSSGGSGYTIPKRTLRKDYTGDDVLSVQTRLKELGYYTGALDSHYGSGTIAAVAAFQQKHGLQADGLAGTQTYAILFSVNAQKADSSTSSDSSDNANSSTGNGSIDVEITVPESGYETLRKGSTGTQVTQLQMVLSNLKYEVSVTGTYDDTTVTAVKLFQRLNGLTVDGVAGKDTQTKLYSGNCVTGDTKVENSSAAGVAPDNSDVQLLHWFNDIKSYLKSNRYFTVYDPATGLSWQMRLYSAGNHADSEPVTQADTDIMYKAFGNQWTWNQRAVYVKLANGTWCIASMPNMPHLSGGIDDNGFDGHTCVHFPRTMTECQQNDPKYGVANQNTIRTQWKKLTGEDISW